MSSLIRRVKKLHPTRREKEGIKDFSDYRDIPRETVPHDSGNLPNPPVAITDLSIRRLIHMTIPILSS